MDEIWDEEDLEFRRREALTRQSLVKSKYPDGHVRWLERGGRWTFRYASGRVVHGRDRLKGKRGPRDRYLKRNIGYTLQGIEWKAEVRVREPDNRRARWRADAKLGYIHVHLHADSRGEIWSAIFEKICQKVVEKTFDELTLKAKDSYFRQKRSDQKRRPGPNQYPHLPPEPRRAPDPTPEENEAERLAGKLARQRERLRWSRENDRNLHCSPPAPRFQDLPSERLWRDLLEDRDVPLELVIAAPPPLVNREPDRALLGRLHRLGIPTGKRRSL